MATMAEVLRADKLGFGTLKSYLASLNSFPSSAEWAHCEHAPQGSLEN